MLLALFPGALELIQPRLQLLLVRRELPALPLQRLLRIPLAHLAGNARALATPESIVTTR